MLHLIECLCYVVVPIKYMEENGLVPGNIIVRSLLHHLSNIKAMEECGYFLAVTKLKSIGKGQMENLSRYVFFPVTFFCRTFIPKSGEIMVGVVYSVKSLGVFLKCGPMNHVYLSVRKMPNYHYVSGEKPIFLSNDLSRIEKGVTVRFIVLAVRWKEDNWREFQVIASLDGDSLGPISLTGSDGLEF